MRRLRITISVSFSLLLLFCTTMTAFAMQSVPAPVLKACKAVVRIQTTTVDGIVSGSGFVVANDSKGTYIATNNHVIEDNPFGVSVWIGANDLRTASVVVQSKENDLSILLLSTPAKQLPVLPLSKQAKQGAAAYALGFPGVADILTDTQAVTNSEITVTDGLVSAIREVALVSYGSKVGFLQTNAAVNPGNSGGPLLDGHGHVIGINTLSFASFGTEGVNGAITATELINLMKANGLHAKAAFAPAFRIALIAFGIVALFLAALFVVRKCKANRECTLASYLQYIDRKLSPNEAVSLLMPALLAARNAHQEGRLLLKLSPETICIKNQKASIGEKAIANGHLFVDYAAPEQLTGKSCSVQTDIYTICAVFRSIMVSTDDTAFDPTLSAVLDKGMMKAPTKRYASMQELIAALSPYNIPVTQIKKRIAKKERDLSDIQGAPAALLEAETQNASLKPRKKKRRIWIPIVILSVLLAVAGYFGINYYQAMRYLSQGEIRMAATPIKRFAFLGVLPEDTYAYFSSALWLDEGDYKQAYNVLAGIKEYKNCLELRNEICYLQAASLTNQSQFAIAAHQYDTLGDYKNSMALADETRYREGLYRLSQKDFDYAVDIFTKLANKGYAPANGMLSETNYQWGCALIQQEDFISAYMKLSRIAEYADTKKLLLELKEVLYVEGQRLYRNGNYTRAKSRFAAIAPYGRSADYSILITAHRSYLTEAEAQKLTALIGFEDTNEVVLSSWLKAQYFLTGNWKGDGHYLRFTKNEKDGSYRSSYDLPYYDWGDYFDIVDGIYRLEKKNASEYKNMYRLTIVDKDCIRVYAYRNQKTYTLYRQ